MIDWGQVLVFVDEDQREAWEEVQAPEGGHVDLIVEVDNPRKASRMLRMRTTSISSAVSSSGRSSRRAWKAEREIRRSGDEAVHDDGT